MSMRMALSLMVVVPAPPAPRDHHRHVRRGRDAGGGGSLVVARGRWRGRGSRLRPGDVRLRRLAASVLLVVAGFTAVADVVARRPTTAQGFVPVAATGVGVAVAAPAHAVVVGLLLQLGLHQQLQHAPAWEV